MWIEKERRPGGLVIREIVVCRFHPVQDLGQIRVWGRILPGASINTQLRFVRKFSGNEPKFQ
jgi:hypothetical protein